MVAPPDNNVLDGALMPLVVSAQGGGLGVQLLRRFRGLILEGALAPGERLPSSRSLAKALGCARGTVEACYGDLEAEGLIERRRGDGSYISKTLERLQPVGGSVAKRPAKQGGPGLSPRGRQISAMVPCPFPHSTTPFAGGLPELRAFPWPLWRRLTAASLQGDVAALAGYGDPLGLPRLRDSLACWLRRARGISCRPEQVLILHSAQQALALAATLLFDAGDRVAVEDPGYPGAAAAFTAAGLKIHPLPVDRDGLQAERLRRGHPVAGVYVTPSYQNPLGAVLSLERRIELIQWAAESGSWIIEDGYGGGLAYDHNPIVALAGLGAAARSIYIGTSSKLIFPGLRVAWMVLPEALVEAFTTLRANLDGHTPALAQEILSRFIDEGHFDKHLRSMTALYRHRRGLMLAELKALQRDLPGRILEVWPSNSGLKLAVELAAPHRDAALAATAARHGLELPRLSSCLPRPGQGQAGPDLGLFRLERRRDESSLPAPPEAARGQAALVRRGYWSNKFIFSGSILKTIPVLA